MDLIYTNPDREDVGVLQDYKLDLAYGKDENDFELTIADSLHCCDAGCMLYIEGTEYGGIIDKIRAVTKNQEVIYKGRTWQGILESKVLEPDAGEAYLTVTGEANEAIGILLDRIGLSDLFQASGEDSGMVVNYQMHRYCKAYTGIMNMLASVSGKLQFTFRDGTVVIKAVQAVDYTNDEQFDNDQVEMDIEKSYHPVNHLVCLGKGELTERQVLHLYADANGNISTVQTFTGLEEVSEVHDYANAESLEELEKSGRDKLKEYNNADSVDMDFDAESFTYDIGDIVGAKEHITGIEVTERITKKIVTINKGIINIQYGVGE